MPETVTEYLTNSTDLKTVADAIRGKTGGTANLTYPSGFASAISGIASDCNATASHILSGKTAYVGNSKITGNIQSKSSDTYNTSTSDRTIAAGQYISGVQTIKAVTTSNISAENIKKGVVVKVGDANSAGRIKNVTGTCVPVTLALGSCAPYMWKNSDIKPPAFYATSGGWFASSSSGDKYFQVPCPIKMTYYAQDTSSSTSTVTFQPGVEYRHTAYSGVVYLVGGGGLTQFSVYKVVRWETA